MLKPYRSIKSSLVIFFLSAVPMLLCCNSGGVNALDRKQRESGRVIVLVGSSVEAESFNNLSTYLSKALESSNASKKLVFAHIRTTRSKHDYLMALYNMHNRAELLHGYVLEEIAKHGWDKRQDEFVLMGYREQGLAALEVAEALRKEINLTKVIVVSAPLNGYDFYHADYGRDWGAIGQLITGMRQAISGQGSTIVEELTPGSDYLKKRQAFIESQTDEEDLKFYIADASIRKLCLGGGASANQQQAKKLHQEVETLFNEVAKAIRGKYQQANRSRNPDDLPGVEEYLRLRKFLEKTDRQGFYTYYKYLNGEKDHDGKTSVATQRGDMITNPRVQRGSFDSYGGTLFIPYKELKDLKPLGLFTEAEYTLNNTKLYDALLKFILDWPELQGPPRCSTS